MLVNDVLTTSSEEVIFRGKWKVFVSQCQALEMFINKTIKILTIDEPSDDIPGPVFKIERATKMIWKLTNIITFTDLAQNICSDIWLWALSVHRSSGKTVQFSEQIMSVDKYSNILTSQIETIVLMWVWCKFCNIRLNEWNSNQKTKQKNRNKPQHLDGMTTNCTTSYMWIHTRLIREKVLIHRESRWNKERNRERLSRPKSNPSGRFNHIKTKHYSICN